MNRFDYYFMARATECWDEIEPSEMLGFLKPKCKEILTEERLMELLESGPLRVKFGIDPTASDIHLGHVVPILVLNLFAKMGHQIDFIVGDFTAMIGDPTARDTGRNPLTPQRIVENMRTYALQIGKYIDLSRITLHHNSTWLNPMSLAEVFTIFQQINLSEAMQREDFRSRMKNDQGVSLAEVCYGVLMGIDSVHLETQVEIGGIDQLLNFQQCRKVMRQSKMAEEVIIMTPILEGTSGDGRKMSKSYQNYVAVESSLEEKFGKIMSIPDRLIFPYFCCFADIHQKEIPQLERFIERDPLEAKKQLATIVASLETKSIVDGLEQRELFERKFSQKTINDDDCVGIEATKGSTFFDSLFQTSNFKSKSDLRRLFEQQGVRIVDNNQILKISDIISQEEVVVRVGPRRFFKIFCR